MMTRTARCADPVLPTCHPCSRAEVVMQCHVDRLRAQEGVKKKMYTILDATRSKRQTTTDMGTTDEYDKERGLRVGLGHDTVW